MIRFLIIAHSPLASAMKAVGCHLCAEASSSIEAIDVLPGQGPDEVADLGTILLDRLGPGETLILTDAFGSTPGNAAKQLGERPDTRVVAGFNLPALWRAVDHRSEPVDRVAELAVSGGQHCLMHVNVTPPQSQSKKPPDDDSRHHHHQQ